MTRFLETLVQLLIYSFLPYEPQVVLLNLPLKPELDGREKVGRVLDVSPVIDSLVDQLAHSVGILSRRVLHQLQVAGYDD